jgi:hypothetical protein
MAYSDRRSKITGCLLMPVILAVAGWLMLTLLFPGPYTSAFPRTFNSTLWKQNDKVETDIRCAMIADLRFRVGLKGRSRAELVDLLGHPQDQDDAPETSYWLLCPSLADIWILEIRWEGDHVADDCVRDT